MLLITPFSNKNKVFISIAVWCKFAAHDQLLEVYKSGPLQAYRPAIEQVTHREWTRERSLTHSAKSRVLAWPRTLPGLNKCLFAQSSAVIQNMCACIFIMTLNQNKDGFTDAVWTYTSKVVRLSLVNGRSGQL